MVEAPEHDVGVAAGGEARMGLRVAAILTGIVAVARVVAWFAESSAAAALEGAGSDSDASARAVAAILTLQTMMRYVAGVYVVVVAALASAWSRGRGWVRMGQAFAVFATLLDAAGMFVLVQSNDAPFELREGRFELARQAMAWGGFVSTLALVGMAAAAPTVRWARAMVLALASLGSIAVFASLVGIDLSMLPSWSWLASGTALMASMAIAWWCGAVPHPAPSPVYARAAQGVWLLQVGLLSRVGVSVIAAGVLAVAMSARHGVGALLSVHVVTHAAIAVMVLVGLHRYATLPGAGQRRDAVAALAVGVVLGVALEAWSAHALWRLVTAIEGSGEGPYGLVSSEQLIPLQHAVVWIGRAAAVVGMASVLLLVSTLRRTARWLEHHLEDERGQLIAFVTVLLGGAVAMVMGAMAMLGGATPPVALLVIAGLAALATSVWLLVAWVRLFAALRAALMATASR